MYILAFANMKHFYKEEGRIHYANLIVYEIDHSKHTRGELLHQFANAIEGIRTLRNLGMPNDHCNYLEHFFFSTLPCHLRHWLLSRSIEAFKHIRYSLSSMMWSPDYIWKSGPNKGRSTLQIMGERWDKHHQNDNDI